VFNGSLKPAYGPEFGTTQAVIYFPDNSDEVLVYVPWEIGYPSGFPSDLTGALQGFDGLVELFLNPVGCFANLRGAPPDRHNFTSFPGMGSPVDLSDNPLIPDA
jgi:hypothetical protein